MTTETPFLGERRAFGSTPRTVAAFSNRKLRAVAAALVLAALGLCGFAGREFRILRSSGVREIPLSRARLVEQGDLICGELTTDLPTWRLHWDGEPPRAALVDTATGEAVAPPLLSEASLSLNPRGVLWSDRGGCRFVLDRATFDRVGDRLVLRAEQVRSRAGFYGAGLSALVAGLAAILCRQIERVRAAGRDRRSGAICNELRITSFVLLALASGLAFFPGLPVVPMSTDSTSINSFAAGLHSPETFTDDPLLADPRNFTWYTPLYVRIVQAFGALGFHYDTSRAALSVVTTLLGLFGYYRLFRAISGSAAYAYAATLGLWFMKANYPPNEVWVPVHVLPRTVYGALLPWVAWLSLRYVRSPRQWSIPAAISALLFYVHPVSSPALTGALLTGFVCGARGTFRSRLGWGMLAAAAALAVMLPYTRIYAARYSETVVPDPAIMAQAIEIARARLAPGFYDLDIYTRDLGIFLLTNPRYWVGLAVLAGLLAGRRRTLSVRVCSGMVLGFVIVTYFIPAADLFVANRLGRLPFQVDLIRNLRYADVLLLAVIGVALRELPSCRRPAAWLADLRLSAGPAMFQHQFKGALGVAAAGLFVGLFYCVPVAMSAGKLTMMAADNIRILIGRPSPAIAEQLEVLRAVQTLRRPHEIVSGPLYLRQAYVPTAPTLKDLGMLAYANPVGLVKAKRQIDRADACTSWPMTLERAQTAAQALEAELLVLDRYQVAPSLARSEAVLFQNASNLLIRVASKEPPYTTPRLTRGESDPRSAQE